MTWPEIELPWVLAVQSTLRPWDAELQCLTDAIHPITLLVVVCPVIYVLHLLHRGDYGGLGALTATLTAEWVNTLLKFPLAGDRPYWVDSRVRQFDHTCESGYGMPSGHVMGVATLLYYLLNRYSTSYNWLFFGLGTFLVALVGVSRVHTGSHFPSQVLAGLVMAYALAYAVYRGTVVPLSQMHTWRSSKVINCAVTLVVASYVAAFAELKLLQMLGQDPMASLVLARRGCQSLAAVAKTTSPMKSIARAGGVIFGSGAGVALRQRLPRRHTVLVKGGMGVLLRTTLTCTALAYAMEAALVAATPDDERLHNAYAVLHNVVLYFMLTWMVPALVERAERSYRQGEAAD